MKNMRETEENINIPAGESEEERGEMTMEEFKKEIREIKEREEKGELTSVHLIPTKDFPGLDISRLTEEDKRVWERFKQRKLTLEEYNKYRRGIPRGDNRTMFAAFLGNKFGAQINKEQIEEMEKKDRENNQ